MKQYRDPIEWRRSSNYDDTTTAGQFIAIARDILRSSNKEGPNWESLASRYAQRPHHGRAESFAKAAVVSVDTDVWETSDGRFLSEAYLSAIAPDNLIDAVASFAYPLPDRGRNVIVATGAIAQEVAEGAGKPLTRFELDATESDRGKVAAIIVVSKEVAVSEGKPAENLIRRLLRDAVLRASNEALLNRIPTISATAGADALASLKNGLSAAAQSSGYVVAATPAITRELALNADGRMGVNGGEYIGGVVVLPALEVSSGGPDLVVIPASSIALRDHGISLRSSGQTSLEMSDAPTMNSATPTGAEMVSLFQANLVGLLVERLFEIRATEPAVEVG